MDTNVIWIFLINLNAKIKFINGEGQDDLKQFVKANAGSIIKYGKHNYVCIIWEFKK